MLGGGSSTPGVESAGSAMIVPPAVAMPCFDRQKAPALLITRDCRRQNSRMRVAVPEGCRGSIAAEPLPHFIR
jgi:hypothetical protein